MGRAAAQRLVLGGGLLACLWALQGFAGVLEFNRQQILQGEFWRIWTGHLVHTDTSHLLLNVAAALAIYIFYFANIRPAELLRSGLVFGFLLSIALLHLHPELAWYNGLSGLLHAFVVYYSMRLARNGGAIYWAILGCAWLKVAVETMLAHAGHPHMLGDMAVISEAHLLGALIGTLSGVVHGALSCARPWSDRRQGAGRRRSGGGLMADCCSKNG